MSRLCEVQDSSSRVNVCGLSLPPASLTPLLRALKLQASLTELRISANRLNNDLLPERLGYVRNPRSLMEGKDTLCRDDIGDLPGSPEHL